VENTAFNVEYKPRTGSEAMCEALLDEGVEYLFGYPGGAIMPFYDALPDYPLKHILTRHEQAAAHAADGYARATNRVGVVVATSGPGATNLVTGLATAQMDSVPLVAITGQVGRPALGKDSFQETNVMGMTLPFTKHSFLVEDPMSSTRRCGGRSRSRAAGGPAPSSSTCPRTSSSPPATTTATAGCARPRRPSSRRRWSGPRCCSGTPSVPLILAGHGVTLAGAEMELRLLAERTGIPVVTTLLG
jgi:acetolactate synthase-1/2/3 large subunit